MSYVVGLPNNSYKPMNSRYALHWLIDLFIMFNATFSNISAISWRPVLVVKKPECPERTTDHGQATGKLYHLRLRIECSLEKHLYVFVKTCIFYLVLVLYSILSFSALIYVILCYSILFIWVYGFTPVIGVVHIANHFIYMSIWVYSRPHQ
jgi:hypothetical protein